MADSTSLLIAGLSLMLSTASAVWVGRDAQRLFEKGADLTPRLWPVLVFLVWIVALPCYVVLRQTTWKREIDPLAKAAADSTQSRRRADVLHLFLDMASTILCLSFALRETEMRPLFAMLAALSGFGVLRGGWALLSPFIRHRRQAPPNSGGFG